MKPAKLGTWLFIAGLMVFFGALPIKGEQGSGSNVVDRQDEWIYHAIGTTISWYGALSLYGADINGDERSDVVIARACWGEDNEVAWFENTGDYANPWPKHVIATPPSLDVLFDVFAADLDGDHDVDVITASPSGENLVWYENLGGSPPTWTAHVVPQTKGEVGSAKGMGPSVFAVDFDSDSDVDIVWGGTAYLAWYENDGTSPPSWSEHIMPSTLFLNGGTSVVAATVDPDTDMDIVLAGTGQGELAWYENPSWTERIVDTSPSHISRVSAADLDNDNDVDILGDSYWYENNGASPPSFTRYFVGSVTRTHAADLSGDGYRDVTGITSDLVYWYENDGNSPPSWTGHLAHTPLPFADVIFPLDVDRDNDIDIVVGDDYYGEIGWLDNSLFICGDANGDSVINVADIVYLVNYLYKNGDPPDPIAAGDANCDGIVNVADIVYLVNYLYKGGDPPGC